MGTDQASRPIPERMPSGVPGLDTIVRGGFIRGGIFIIQGPPGAGKTILGHQICFGHIGAGGRALYATLLAENHARMLLHIGQLGFFEEQVIPDRLYYISAYPVLGDDVLEDMMYLLPSDIHARKSNVLIIDAWPDIHETAAS